MTTTRIEDIILAHETGVATWAATKRALVDFPYAKQEWNEGRTLVAVEGHEAITERDTWAEVEDAYRAGRLTRDEFYSVLAGYAARSRAAARQSR